MCEAASDVILCSPASDTLSASLPFRLVELDNEQAGSVYGSLYPVYVWEPVSGLWGGRYSHITSRVC